MGGTRGKISCLSTRRVRVLIFQVFLCPQRTAPNCFHLSAQVYLNEWHSTPLLGSYHFIGGRAYFRGAGGSGSFIGKICALILPIPTGIPPCGGCPNGPKPWPVCRGYRNRLAVSYPGGTGTPWKPSLYPPAAFASFCPPQKEAVLVLLPLKSTTFSYGPQAAKPSCPAARGRGLYKTANTSAA